jgi:uncharacterized membrane protein YfcA
MDPVVVIVVSALIGLFAGFIGGLLGLGGGIVIVPFLIILLGTDFNIAKTASLFAMIPKCIMGTYEHYKLGNIDFRMGITIGIMGAIGAAIGSYAGSMINAKYLIIVFSLFLFVSAARFFMRAEEKKIEGKWIIPTVGLIAGIMAGLLGIGGGVVIVQGMVYIGVSMHMAVGTSLLAIIFNSISGTVSHALMGYISWAVIIPVTLAGMPGIVLGSRYCDRCKAPVLKRYFGVAMVLIGIYLILKALGIVQIG